MNAPESKASDVQAGRRPVANLKLLRTFEAVASHLSFSRAAAELGRSQGTLSVQVRELERQLNVPLLERTTRRVLLTCSGASR
jgi:DNA-binding transcriptional LysR family regulator